MPNEHERARLAHCAALSLLLVSACVGPSSSAPREDAELPHATDAAESAGPRDSVRGDPDAAPSAPLPADGGTPVADGESAPADAEAVSDPEDAVDGGAVGAASSNDAGQLAPPTAAGRDASTQGAGNVDASTTPSAVDCSRAGLAALVDSYLSALSAGDPAGLSVSSTLRFTENGSEMRLGEGSWRTAGILLAQRSALDPDTCGTVTEAAFDAQGKPVLVGVRLKLDGSELTEIESYLVDQLTGPPKSLVGADNSDEWLSSVAAAERSSREQLVQIADAYLDNLGDPLRPAPFATPCDQAVNGLGTAQVADNLDPAIAPSHTCGSVLLPVIPGLPNINASPTHRRYPVADVEAGIAVAFGLVAEDRVSFSMLKVVDGKIRFVESVVGPSVTSPGW